MVRNPFKKKDKPPAFKEGLLAFLNNIELSDNPYSESNAESASLWVSGWEEAFEVRKVEIENNDKEVAASLAAYNDSAGMGWYLKGCIITAVIAFIACWIYAIAKYGFLIGVGLGWIPSFFIALIAGFIWPLIALVLIIGMLIVIFLFYYYGS